MDSAAIPPFSVATGHSPLPLGEVQGEGFSTESRIGMRLNSHGQGPRVSTIFSSCLGEVHKQVILTSFTDSEAIKKR
jgi:hypothetical protein